MKIDYSNFILNRKDFQDVLNMFKRLLKKEFPKTICKIRVMPGGIELSTTGIYRCINCETTGLYEILVPLKLLYAYAISNQPAMMEFTFRDGELQCGSSIFSSPMIKVKNWGTSADDGLHINYSDLDLIKVAFEQGDKYLEEHNLTGAYKELTAKLEKDLYQSYLALEGYGITQKDIRNLVYGKFHFMYQVSKEKKDK